MSASSSLAATVAHAVDFLTRPLLKAYAPATIVKLQLVLEANLTAHYAQSWDIADPLRGSGRRCLTLSPDSLPPRAVYAAAIASGVQWFDWITLLGAREFDFFVDPGCVSMRLDRKGPASRLITIWADELPSPTVPKQQQPQQPQPRRPAPLFAPRPAKTVAQQLLEDDTESDDQLFSMLAAEIRAPTWMTPVCAEFPRAQLEPRSLSPLSGHSRCSSRSSNSSSGFSFSSAESARSTSASSVASRAHSADECAPQPRQSRRERARQARVYVDTSKKEVTPYDGGKTTVLTGGVMLGGGPKKAAAPRPAAPAAHGWRVVAPMRI